MNLSFEIDDNVLQIALYKMRAVNGGTNVKLVDKRVSDNVPYATMLGDNLDYLGILIEIEGIKSFIPYDYLIDMCSLQFGQQVAENYVKNVINKK